MSAYSRLCLHLNAAEEWMDRQPTVIAVGICLMALIVFTVAIVAVIAWLVGGGSNCAPGYTDARVESHEYISHGKTSSPGIVMRHICVPE